MATTVIAIVMLVLSFASLGIAVEGHTNPDCQKVFDGSGEANIAAIVISAIVSIFFLISAYTGYMPVGGASNLVKLGFTLFFMISCFILLCFIITYVEKLKNDPVCGAKLSKISLVTIAETGIGILMCFSTAMIIYCGIMLKLRKSGLKGSY